MRYQKRDQVHDQEQDIINRIETLRDQGEGAGSILKDLVVNQYQAILLGGVAAVSAIALTPLPALIWLGAELILLPLLDSGPLRRLVHRKRNARLRQQAEARRAQLISALDTNNAQQYREMERVCRSIEANYQGLNGISQIYLSEQREKLDTILSGCLQRMLALKQYQRMLSSRDSSDIEKEIKALDEDLKQTGLTERERVALEKNRQLKQKLLASFQEARGTMKALATELDSMSSLLEVLHQNSISMRDPQAISHELDQIVRQSEDSEKAVREMEALLGSGAADWMRIPEPAGPAAMPPKSAQQTAAANERRRVKN